MGLAQYRAGGLEGTRRVPSAPLTGGNIGFTVGLGIVEGGWVGFELG
jgi:hypothetical protein